MLREQPDTDGIICANDLIAIGVLNILKEQGIQVPQQDLADGREQLLVL